MRSPLELSASAIGAVAKLQKLNYSIPPSKTTIIYLLPLLPLPPLPPLLPFSPSPPRLIIFYLEVPRADILNEINNRGDNENSDGIDLPRPAWQHR